MHTDAQLHTEKSQPTDGSTVKQQGVQAWGLISPPLSNTHTHTVPKAAQQGVREREKAAEERETIVGIASTVEGKR